jgi:hypothetical protein
MIRGGAVPVKLRECLPSQLLLNRDGQRRLGDGILAILALPTGVLAQLFRQKDPIGPD